MGKAKCIADGSTEEVFWLAGPSGVRSYEALKCTEPTNESLAFSKGGCYTMRDGWSGTDNVMLIDCGEIGALSGGHGHADTLSIVVAAHGKPLLVDPGTYTYHEAKKIRDQFRSSMAHNTLVVDGASSSKPGRTFNWTSRAEATAEEWIAED